MLSGQPSDGERKAAAITLSFVGDQPAQGKVKRALNVRFLPWVVSLRRKVTLARLNGLMQSKAITVRQYLAVLPADRREPGHAASQDEGEEETQAQEPAS